MSQTSSTPGRAHQSNDSRSRQSLLEENQRLKKARKWALEEWDKDRQENFRIRMDKEDLRICAEEAEHRAEEAEHRAEEAEHQAEEAEHQAEEAGRRAEKAELQLSRIQGSIPGFINAWRAMGQACTNVTDQAFANVGGQVIDDSKDAIYLPGDEYEVNYQGQSIAQTSGAEEIDDQGQQGSQASQHEEVDEQSQSIAQASVGEEIDDQGQQGSQASQHEEADDQGQSIAQASVGEEIDDQGQQSDQADEGEEIDCQDQQSDQAIEGENALHSFEPETISNPNDDSQYESSQIRVSIPRLLDTGNHQEPSIKGLKGFRSPALSPPPSSSPSQPQQSQSISPSMGETTNPSDQPSANDTGNRPDIKNSLDNLGDMERALPTLRGNSKQKEQDFPVLRKGSSQIPGIPTVSTAPPIPKKPTVIPQMEISTWDRLGAVDKKGTDGSHGIDASYFASWPDLEESDTGGKVEEQKPKTEISGKESVAAGKQPEHPSLAKLASSATGGDPPKPIGTKSYAGTAQAPPPKVEETAQSSRTVLKSGNAAAKAAARQTDASPADQADNTSGFQTVTSQKGRVPSNRGQGSLGRGEAGSNKNSY